MVKKGSRATNSSSRMRRGGWFGCQTLFTTLRASPLPYLPTSAAATHTPIQPANSVADLQYHNPSGGRHPNVSQTSPAPDTITNPCPAPVLCGVLCCAVLLVPPPLTCSEVVAGCLKADCGPPRRVGPRTEVIPLGTILPLGQLLPGHGSVTVLQRKTHTPLD